MNIKKSIFLALAFAVIAAGCNNVGNVPQPMSPEETQAAVNKAKPQEQIDWINRSPMPAEEKARRIKEIEEKYGVKAGAVTGASGAPQ